jgi:phosphoglycerate dehydrogenase-like enzyme
MDRSFTIWTNVRLEAESAQRLQQGIAPHHLVGGMVASAVTGDAPDPPPLEQAHIAFGQPDPQALLTCPNIRWIHITTAGYTRYDRDDLRRHFARHGTAMTNSSSVYAEPCAQHVLAMMLSLARRLPHALRDQWQDQKWRGGHHRAGSILLNGQTVLLLGFGAIARRLAQLLGPLEMRLIAVRRTPSGSEPVQTYPVTELDRLLPHAHHIVNLLPANPGTRQFVSRERISLMRPEAIFYNIGRGSTIDQPALIDALTTGQLAAACLDVTDPEPLPPDHPLWTTPNCFITPHSAGGHQGEQIRLVDHFLENLTRFQTHQPLLDRIM